MLFRDSHIVNKILESDTPYECKHVSYQINGVDNDKWKEDGFNLYLEGVQAKFSQNRNLWSMLKTTKPKELIEASTDRL